MNEINVDAWAVRRAASNIGSYLADISTLSGEIRKIENMVRAAWKGDHVDDYIECLEATRIKVENMGDVFLDIKVNLGNIANSVQEAERRLRELMESENGGSGGR